MCKQPNIVEGLFLKMDKISMSLYQDLTNIKEEIHSFNHGDPTTNSMNILNQLEIFKNSVNKDLFSLGMKKSSLRW